MRVKPQNIFNLPGPEDFLKIVDGQSCSFSGYLHNLAQETTKKCTEMFGE